MIPETVETDIVIQACHTHRTWHAALPNGHVVMAFVPEDETPPILAPGARVRARLSVSDFSRAHVLQAAAPAAMP